MSGKQTNTIYIEYLRFLKLVKCFLKTSFDYTLHLFYAQTAYMEISLLKHYAKKDNECLNFKNNFSFGSITFKLDS